MPRPSVKQMSVQELQQKIDQKEDFKLIDCREENEYEIAQIPGATLVPLSQFAEKISQVVTPKDDIVIHCHHGGRSQKASEYLLSLGFTKVANLAGGIDAWSVHIDPKVSRY